MSNQQKKFINICVWCAVVLFAVRCFLSWESILKGVSVYDLFGYAGEAIGIAVLLAGIYEKFLWRINPFESTPKLSKQYTGTFKSSYDQVERSASLEIRQTLLSVHVTLISDESKSKSLSASIDEILGEIQLTYCYLNTPKSAYRDMLMLMIFKNRSLIVCLLSGYGRSCAAPRQAQPRKCSGVW